MHRWIAVGIGVAAVAFAAAPADALTLPFHSPGGTALGVYPGNYPGGGTAPGVYPGAAQPAPALNAPPPAVTTHKRLVSLQGLTSTLSVTKAGRVRVTCRMTTSQPRFCRVVISVPGQARAAGALVAGTATARVSARRATVVVGLSRRARARLRASSRKGLRATVTVSALSPAHRKLDSASKVVRLRLKNR